MGYLPPTTIADALPRPLGSELILPAIQHECAWKPSQVVGPFDSIMRGYPIASFLSWKVEPEMVKKFRFYGFLKKLNECDVPSTPHRPSLAIPDC